VDTSGSRGSEEDRSRFEALYLAHYQDIYAYVGRRSPIGGLDVADIVADVFATAWRRFDVVPAMPDDRLWLFGVARRCLLESHRRQSRRDSLISRLKHQRQIPAEPHGAALDNAVARVRTAVAELRALDREALILVMWDGLSHAEAAEVLGCSVNAVALRIAKAKERLRQRLLASSADAPAQDLIKEYLS
jgi:RNA polymerase sigma factor (sigma-70 family)